jgi:hypothetical protein
MVRSACSRCITGAVGRNQNPFFKKRKEKSFLRVLSVKPAPESLLVKLDVMPASEVTSEDCGRRCRYLTFVSLKKL